MSAVGKPFRFLGWVLGGWVVLRAGIVLAPGPLPETEPKPTEKPQLVEAARPASPAKEGIKPVRSATFARPAPQEAPLTAPSTAFLLPRSSPAPADPSPSTATAAPLLIATPLVEAVPGPQAERAGIPVGPALPTPAATSRWSLSGWVLWRRDAGASLAQGPLLGGSQSGVRLDYRLSDRGSFALYGRLTRAMDRPFAEEAAVGIAVRPIEGLPVSFMAERRQKLGRGGRSGFAFFIAGGITPKALTPRLELEGYGQAGVVAQARADAFADGKLALDYRLTPRDKAPDLALGIGISGGAQPGASRLDIGPELRLRLPVAGGPMRLSAEWRQRIAGTARPASGPAIALVTEF